MIKWKLGPLAGFQSENGSYENIHSGHFIDENGDEYDENGIFVRNVQDDDEYKN